MAWLYSLDTWIFHFINLKLANPVFDTLMPFFAGNRLFIPFVTLLGLALLWKGGVRGRLFVTVIALCLALGDGLVVNQIKHSVGRARPSLEVSDARVLVGTGSAGSMPSGHAATWFAAALIAYAYYPRTRFFMFPLAILIAFSRCYVGVHYPSDVLAGAIFGGGYAAAGLWGFNALWRLVGPRYFPLWWERLPRLILPPDEQRPYSMPSPHRTLANRQFLAEQQWFRLAHVIILLALAARLFYVSENRIDLSEDEAYQWIWSKHLDLSYYSKPPLIAWAHFASTYLWGDTEFGVRFLPPIVSTLVALIVLRLMRRWVGAHAALITILILLAIPLLTVGSTLMTIDPFLVLFWTAALASGWKALQPNGTSSHWLQTGLWTGLAFLSKYTGALLVPCFALYFLLWRPARVHLRRPGPWLGLVTLLLCALPVVIWNNRHEWVAITHVSENAKLERAWAPTLRYFFEFLGAEFGLLNPVFFVGTLLAMVLFWRSGVDRAAGRYLFCLGAPVFLGYWLYTLHSRVQPNWIAASVVPLICLMVLYWKDCWLDSLIRLKPWLKGGIILGILAGLILCETSLLTRLTGVKLSAKLDPSRRVRGIEKMAKTIEAERQLLSADDDVFIVTGHYGLAGQLSFYIPKAKAALPSRPLVYPRFTRTPKNQFYFWPEYRYWETRKGEDALYVLQREEMKQREVPDEVAAQFETIQDLGTREILDRGQVVHTLQLYLLKNLR
jgi:membrane-associated phospholipid phosphatase